MTTLRDVEEHVGVYYSREWVIKNILQMSEEDMENMKKQIETEKEVEPDDDMDDI
jgi:hypothetical protein